MIFFDENNAYIYILDEHCLGSVRVCVTAIFMVYYTFFIFAHLIRFEVHTIPFYVYFELENLFENLFAS